MKKSSRQKVTTLGQLIMAVSSCSKNDMETVVAVGDLLESGRCRLSYGTTKVRAKLV